MDNLKKLLTQRPIQNVVRPSDNTRAPQQWNELVEWFYKAALPTWNKKYGTLTIGRMRAKLRGLEVKDLLYMQSVYKDTARRSGNVAAAKEFFWSLNPKKHNNHEGQA